MRRVKISSNERDYGHVLELMADNGREDSERRRFGVSIEICRTAAEGDAIPQEKIRHNILALRSMANWLENNCLEVTP